jgi:hypothetical protein
MAEHGFSILHLASDEKFIDAANYIFEKAFPGCNHFVIPKSKYNDKLVYVKRTGNVEFAPYNKELIPYLTNLTQAYDCVVLHGITELNSTIFLTSDAKQKFVGILWGAELYKKENFSDRNFLGELTSAIKLPEGQVQLTEMVKDQLRKLLYKKVTISEGAIRLAANELRYFGVPYYEEFEFFSSHKILSGECRFVPFTYYPLEYLIRGIENLSVNGNDILIGNSANYSNNHLEAFKKIEEIGFGDRKIVVPLSYGDLRYGRFIGSKGIELFQSSFIPLKDFVSLNDYIRKLQGCGIAIMNHFRQQAVGTVFSLLWLGTKVYLSESNTFYHYLRRAGIHIFSIEKELNVKNQNVFENLSEPEIKNNRSILETEIKEEKVIENLRKSIQLHFMPDRKEA